MYPSLNIFGLSLSVYSLTAIIGAFLSGFVFHKLIRRHAANNSREVAFLLCVTTGVLLGSRLLYAVVNMDVFFQNLKYFGFWVAISDSFSGAVFYGGLLGGLVAGIIAVKVMRLDLITYSASMAPIIPLFHSIARIGCFCAGCCYGIKSDFGFSAHGNTFVYAVNDVSRFPVQLLEAMLNLVLSLVLFYLLKRSENNMKLKGWMLRIYLMSYACIRIFTEFFRGDKDRGFVGILSTSQFISVIILVACLATIFLPKRIKTKKISA